MSSGTSAFFSNQNTVASSITAGIWEVPAINYCGEEDEMDKDSGENIIVEGEEHEGILNEENRRDMLPVVESDIGSVDQEESAEENEQNVDTSEEDIIDREVNADNLVEEIVEEVLPGEETEVDCEEKDADSTETGADDATPIEVDCKDENDKSEQEQNITSSEETKEECGNNKDESKKENENEKDNTTEDETATKDVDGDENAKNKSESNVDLDVNKEKGLSEGESQLEPDHKDTMPVTESTEMKPDNDSTENKEPEDSYK